MGTERSLVRSWIANSGLIIAAITAMIYFCVLSYQIGFCTYFQLPFQYISLSQTMILSVLWPLFIIITCIFIFVICVLTPISALFLTYRDRITRFYESLVASTRPRNPSMLPLDHFFRSFMVGVAVFVIILSIVSFSRYLGQLDAEHWKEFYIINNYPNFPETLVVLLFYNDRLITAPLDSTTREVEKRFFILKMSEMGETPLIHKKIGRLKVKEEVLN